MPVIDTRTIAVVNVAAPTITIAGRITSIYYSHDTVAGGVGWTAWAPLWDYEHGAYATPTVEQGKMFGLAVAWTNTGNVNIRGTTSVQLTKPDGSTLAVGFYENQNMVAVPGSGWIVGHRCILDQAGSYSAVITLYGVQA